MKQDCKTCLFDSLIVKIMEDGECEMCKLQTTLRETSKAEDWLPMLEQIKNKGSRKKYDCLIGISGGEDSSLMLYLAVKVWELRPLVIHFNNRTNRPQADNNIKVLTEKLNVDFIEYFTNQKEYNDLCDAFLVASVCDADLANDVAMAKLMDTTAKQYGINYILNGHSFREEGSSPKKWSFIDTKYVQSVYRSWTGRDMVNYPLYTIWDQVKAGLMGIRQVRPFHYLKIDRKPWLIKLKELGYQDYGGKHNENIYTAFVGNYLLPTKFGIDKRRTYLGAQIREGVMQKQFAKNILSEPAIFDLNDLGGRRDHILDLVELAPVRDRSAFNKTDFKALRPLFWILMKIGVFPKTAFRKYCF